ncbi:MAG: lipid droplet-associated protein [Pseudonocardiaceae bacterium]
MRPIPLPVRVAAGLVVTALEQARKFPEQLAELPVTAASRAVQTGMRVQQRVTQLAIKGDEVFSLFRPVEDTPPWARFDEDDEVPDGASGSHSADAAAEPNGVVHRINPGSDLPVVPGPREGHGEVDEADVARDLTPERPAGARSADELDPGSAPPALPGYDRMSLAQLRGKLRALSLQELEALLDHEHSHQDRAPFVTMLSNRIVTVRSR